MNTSALMSLFETLGVTYLSSNRYQPARLAASDVRQTIYYKRNRKEFETLARRYGPVLDNKGRETSAAAFRALDRLEVRNLGGLLGYGLFARKPLSAGELVGEYTGIVRAARPGRPLVRGGYSNDYAWGFPKVRVFGRPLEIDAREAGGLLRFANHALQPSVYTEHFALDGKWRIVFVARGDIRDGEEITVGYGDAYWAAGDRELIV